MNYFQVSQCHLHPCKKEENQKQDSSVNTSFQLPEEVQKGLTFSVSQTSQKEEIQLSSIKTYKHTPYTSFPQPAIALVKTIKHYLATDTFKAFYKQARKKASAKVVFLLDTSASMGIDKQLAYIKGILQKTFSSYPNKKVSYAIVGLEQASAKIIQPFTDDKEQLSHITHTLRAGGKTNLGDAFFKVFELLKSINKKTVQLFILTDGKANAGHDNPFEYAVKTYKSYLSKLKHSTIIDTENSFVKLGRAKVLAERLHIRYVSLDAIV